MMWLSRSRARGTAAKVFLAVIAALLAAILIAGGIAEAQRGGGGRGGGGGGGKPSGASKSSPGSKGSSAEKAGDKGPPSGVANSSSRYYNSPNYGIRHGALSNFSSGPGSSAISTTTSTKKSTYSPTTISRGGRSWASWRSGRGS